MHRKMPVCLFKVFIFPVLPNPTWPGLPQALLQTLFPFEGFAVGLFGRYRTVTDHDLLKLLYIRVSVGRYRYRTYSSENTVGRYGTYIRIDTVGNRCGKTRWIQQNSYLRLYAFFGNYLCTGTGTVQLYPRTTFIQPFKLSPIWLSDLPIGSQTTKDNAAACGSSGLFSL